MILSIDLGTTNWKAGLIAPDGTVAALNEIPTPIVTEEGHPCYDPQAMPHHLARLLGAFGPQALSGITRMALTGMAEAGLMLDRATHRPLSMIWPWFDRRAIPLYEQLRTQPLFAGRPEVTGLPNSFKYGIYKFLTLLNRQRRPGHTVMWCGLVAYAGLLLTGECAEDATLAARTLCLDIRRAAWDEDFLRALGLSAESLPRLVATGQAIGAVRPNAFGLPEGVPVCIAGHDHICAAHAVGALERGDCFLSTGTAQVMLRTTEEAETASGLSYGPSPVGPPYTCLGSIQSAGGSINYWKKLLFPHEDFSALMKEASAAAPSSLLYFPYLAGSGAPHLDPNAHGALLGLTEATNRGEILAAVYEGIAMETRYVLARMGFRQEKRLICLGGLTRHDAYMQTLADITGASVGVPAVDEGTLYGAARLASDSLPPLAPSRIYPPDITQHQCWSERYERRYLPLMKLASKEES